jgi:hypothetical protein
VTDLELPIVDPQLLERLAMDDRLPVGAPRRLLPPTPAGVEPLAGAGAESLVRAIVEDFLGIAPSLAERVNPESQPFESERWAPFGKG